MPVVDHTDFLTSQYIFGAEASPFCEQYIGLVFISDVGPPHTFAV